MSVRESNQSREHEKLVRMMANYYSMQEYPEVRTSLEGYDQPPQIGGFIPDVYAKGKDPLIVLEAETCDTINSEHTEKQWRSFSAFAQSIRGEFHIAVPKSCVEEARTQLNRLGITATIWTPSETPAS